jgi:hypothetical protein
MPKLAKLDLIPGCTNIYQVFINGRLITIVATMSQSEEQIKPFSNLCPSMPGKVTGDDIFNGDLNLHRIGMHLLFYGKHEISFVQNKTVEEHLKELSIKVNFCCEQ